MHYLPQEIETWYLIPAIRREISKCLISDFQTSYEKIGNILGVSKAAISQYTKGKRAAKISLPKELVPKIMATCKNLDRDNKKAVREIDKLLSFIREKGLTCKVCGKGNEGKLENCKEIRFEDGNYILISSPKFTRGQSPH
jgi:uncharacterized protein